MVLFASGVVNVLLCGLNSSAMFRTLLVRLQIAQKQPARHPQASQFLARDKNSSLFIGILKVCFVNNFREFVNLCERSCNESIIFIK
jgi:hypothetical protein